jgi:hypothetical protein
MQRERRGEGRQGGGKQQRWRRPWSCLVPVRAAASPGLTQGTEAQRRGGDLRTGAHEVGRSGLGREAELEATSRSVVRQGRQESAGRRGREIHADRMVTVYDVRALDGALESGPIILQTEQPIGQ